MDNLQERGKEQKGEEGAEWEVGAEARGQKRDVCGESRTAGEAQR